MTTPAITVPALYPLTPAAIGLTVFVVINTEGDEGGVYPTPERALSYVTDWVKTGDPDAVVTCDLNYATDAYGNYPAGGYEVQVNGISAYSIQKTQFRL